MGLEVRVQTVTECADIHAGAEAENDELIAAPTRREVATTHARAKGISRIADDEIPEFMAVVIVGTLQASNVNEAHGDRLDPAKGFGPDLPDSHFKPAAVGPPRAHHL